MTSVGLNNVSGTSVEVKYIAAYAVLGLFAKLRRTTIIFVISAFPSVLFEHLGSHWTDFHEIRGLNIFLKSVKKINFD
jgi:hypothetical protein